MLSLNLNVLAEGAVSCLLFNLSKIQKRQRVCSLWENCKWAKMYSWSFEHHKFASQGLESISFWTPVLQVVTMARLPWHGTWKILPMQLDVFIAKPVALTRLIPKPLSCLQAYLEYSQKCYCLSGTLSLQSYTQFPGGLVY